MAVLLLAGCSMRGERAAEIAGSHDIAIGFGAPLLTV
jgi:hypothetical protein